MLADYFPFFHAESQRAAVPFPSFPRLEATLASASDARRAAPDGTRQSKYFLFTRLIPQ